MLITASELSYSFHFHFKAELLYLCAYFQMALSEFQKEKLAYYFKIFDSDANGLLEKCDLKGIMKDLLKYTGWTEDSSPAKEIQEVHEVFFEVLFEKAKKTKKENPSVSLSEWFCLWEKLLPGAMSLCDFPVWLRLLPKTLFRVIDRNDDGRIDQDELTQFYAEFVKLDLEDAKQKGKLAMDEMTDKGMYTLDIDLYQQIFANFLLGKTGVGPGKYIFGCFDLPAYKFKLVMPHTEDDDVKIQQRRLSLEIIKVPQVKLQAIPH